MDEQERILRGARPGDVISYVDEAGRAPVVETRLNIHFIPRDGTKDAPFEIVHEPSPTGAWGVIGVEPIGDDGTRVKVYLVVI